MNPSSSFATYERALLEKATGDLSAAAAYLEKIVQAEPNWLQAHVELAALYYKLHRQKEGRREREIVDRLSAQEQKSAPSARDPLSR